MVMPRRQWQRKPQQVLKRGRKQRRKWLERGQGEGWGT